MSNTKVVATKATFPLPEGYEFKRHLGSGAYGTVVACTNTKTGEDVAVKRISKVFDRKILTKRTLREIKLLRHFAGHENITCVFDIFKLGEGTDFNEVYMVQELMEADLHQIIRSRQKLTNSHFQYFIYQILRGLKYIHSAQVRGPGAHPREAGRDAGVSRAPAAARSAPPFCRCGPPTGAAPRPQAGQPAGERRLRAQDLRFWPGPRPLGARRQGQRCVHDRVRRDAVVPRARDHALLPELRLRCVWPPATGA